MHMVVKIANKNKIYKQPLQIQGLKQISLGRVLSYEEEPMQSLCTQAACAAVGWDGSYFLSPNSPLFPVGP